MLLIRKSGFWLCLYQCWTVGAIFTFGRSRMFSPDKLPPSGVGRSRSRRIKNSQTYVITLLISNHSNCLREFYKNVIKKGPVLILRDNTIIININLSVMKNTFQPPFRKKTKKTTNRTFGRRNGLKLRPPLP
jgi:hypothetical protein